jgi:hypothetical protein
MWLAGLPAIVQSFVIILQRLGRRLYSNLKLQFVRPLLKPNHPSLLVCGGGTYRAIHIASLSTCSAYVTLLLK